MKRENPLRITAGLLIRYSRFLRNELRVRRLRAKGLRSGGRVYIYEGAKITDPQNVSIGAGSVIGNSHLLSPGKIEIGQRTLIGHDVFLCTGSHDIYGDRFDPVISPIVIGDNVWVANGATIMPGVRVGNNAVVAAKAVVFRNVPDGAVAVGNPAKATKVGREMSPEFSPLSLANIDYEASLQRLRECFRKFFSPASSAAKPSAQPAAENAVNPLMENKEIF